MLNKIFNSQKYINEVRYTNQSIDINFDLIRDLPINLSFDNLRYGFQIAGVQPDISQIYLDENPQRYCNKMVILRSLKI